MIRDIQEQDCQSIVDIYNYYIRETVVSFEETEIDCNEILKRIEKVKFAGLCWLVIEENHKVVGYAYASKWNERVSYRNTVELSVYLDHSVKGRGLGSRLYEELLVRLRKSSIHVVIGGIALPNDQSVKLHEKFGMQQVAHYKEVGFKFGRWLDVGYWQLILRA